MTEYSELVRCGECKFWSETEKVFGRCLKSGFKTPKDFLGEDGERKDQGMTDYSELVKALRCENTGDDECGSSDCPYWSGLGCMDGQLMEDAAAAIEALQKDLATLQKCYEIADTTADEVLKQLPKRGEWIGKSDDDSLVKCSVCGHIRIGSRLWYCKQYVPYCENCGAKMEVQE